MPDPAPPNTTSTSTSTPPTTHPTIPTLPASQITPAKESHMKAALEMGEKALLANETPVGCVLVHNDTIIGRGMNDTNRSMNGTRHAEFLAIEEALRSHPRKTLTETDLYVTVEPCVMCASLLRQYRIRTVYFGCANERFGGTGSILSLHGDGWVDQKGEQDGNGEGTGNGEGNWAIDRPYPVYMGLFHNEAIMLLRRFYVQENEKAPKPRPKKRRELNMEFD